MMKKEINPIRLSSDLIKIKSVTPNAKNSINLISSKLENLGFKCKKLIFGDGKQRVENLYARYGEKLPNLCFAGHVDVVPAGNEEDWLFDPFSGECQDGMILGRGSVDMKSSIASYISATSVFLKENPNFLDIGSLSFLITGDEEGEALNGTKKVVKWLKENNETVTSCVVGEPTNIENIGDTIKIGRRGSYSANLTVHGIQGHVGYPHLAQNPINSLFSMVEPFFKINLDEGNKYFQPSTIMITSIDVRNDTFNIIPSKAELKFNVRFNNLHTADSLTRIFLKQFDKFKVKYDFNYFCNAEPFLTNPDHLFFSMEKAISKFTKSKSKAKKSTSGGTSDARFIKDLCPVIEFGLVGKLMHKVNEMVAVEDIIKLKNIYHEFIKYYFEKKDD